jgi:hypothetical protein
MARKKVTPVKAAAVKPGSVFEAGVKVQCNGVAYFHNAPFDAKGEVGVVTHVEGDMVHFDHASRGNVSAPAANLKAIK